MDLGAELLVEEMDDLNFFESKECAIVWANSKGTMFSSASFV